MSPPRLLQIALQIDKPTPLPIVFNFCALNVASAEEGCENILNLEIIHPNALVRYSHDNQQCVVRFDTFVYSGRDINSPILLELDRVLENIEEDLLKPSLVKQEKWVAILDFEHFFNLNI